MKEIRIEKVRKRNIRFKLREYELDDKDYGDNFPHTTYGERKKIHYVNNYFKIKNSCFKD